MARVTKTILLARAARAFEAVGLNTGPAYVEGKAQVGATYLAKTLSGWDIEQIANDGGGVRQLNGWCNSLSAAEMVAFLDGMVLAHSLLMKRESA